MIECGVRIVEKVQTTFSSKKMGDNLTDNRLSTAFDVLRNEVKGKLRKPKQLQQIKHLLDESGL